MAMLSIVMVLLLATFFVAKVAVAALWSIVTASFVSTPTNDADDFTRSVVAMFVAL